VNEAFDGARVLLCLSFFIYASWSDYKTREVSNTVWLVLAPLAFALTAVQFVVFAPEALYTYALSFILTSVLAVVLFYAGAFGGADAKALMCLALALPLYPVHFVRPLFNPISPIFPITVFSNAVLLAVLSVFYSVTRNLFWKLRTGKSLFETFESTSLARKILTLLCGYKVNSSELEKTEHSYPLEDISTTETGETERRLLLFPKDEERRDIVTRLSNAVKDGTISGEIWVTPGLPMLIFITLGLMIALLLGDIVWIILRSALGLA
jgi:preflagellin peptidase FlaK